MPEVDDNIRRHSSRFHFYGAEVLEGVVKECEEVTGKDIVLPESAQIDASCRKTFEHKPALLVGCRLDLPAGYLLRKGIDKSFAHGHTGVVDDCALNGPRKL
jgi:hypothetical protein